MGLNDNPLAALRAKAKPQNIVRDRQDRVDATTAPDARKAREVVRSVLSADDPPNVTLTEIAFSIAKVTGDQDVRVALLERAESFVKASLYYQEIQGETQRPIAWLGQDATGQFYGTVPPGTPEHKILLIVAWGALLRAVNEATKVGVQKRTRYTPITLIADPDAAPLALPDPEWT